MPSPNLLLSCLLTGVRFIICGVGGLWLSAFCGMMLVMRLIEEDMKHTIHPLVDLSGLLAAGLLMLFGVGRWRQWLFLIPFTTWPFGLAMFLFLAHRLRVDSGMGYAFAIFGTLLSFSPIWPMAAWYRRKQARPAETEPS